MKTLCYFGDPILRVKCKKVDAITPFIHQVVEEMKIVADAHSTAGLAAPQIGYDLRIFLNYYSKKVDEYGYPICLEEPEVYINPVITKRSKRTRVETEGCLSIPGVKHEVERAYEIRMEYTNLEGKRVFAKEHKWRAQCLQHEYDHLEGVLQIDYLTEKQLKKIQPTLVALEKRTKDQKNQVMGKDIFG